MYATHAGAAAAHRDPSEAVAHRFAERARNRDEFEEAVVGGERDAGSLGVHRLERGVTSASAAETASEAAVTVVIASCSNATAGQCPFPFGRVDDDASEGHAAPRAVVEPEEARLGGAGLARALVPAAHGDAVHGFAAVEDGAA